MEGIMYWNLIGTVAIILVMVSVILIGALWVIDKITD